MSSNSYHFKIGKFECIVVSDGSLTYTEPAPTHFANAPLDQLEQALRVHNIELEQWKEWISPLPCLVIQAGEHKVLLDTGLGNVDFGPNAGRLLENLKAEDIQPGDFDTIILTHAHGDHVGWNTDSNGNALFPHARYYMRKEEWDFWTSEKTLAQPEYEWMTSFVHKQLLPISDRFELLEKDTEIVPGIHALFAPGHTPGHLLVEVASNGAKLLCLGDLIGHPVHLEHPEWHLDPDCNPDQNLRTRRKFFEYAAQEGIHLFAFHFDFPGLGFVRKQNEAWRWQSITAMD